MPLLSSSQVEFDHPGGGLDRQSRAASTPLDRWCRARVLGHLARLRSGVVAMYEGDTPEHYGSAAGDSAGLKGELYVRHPRFFRRVVFGGSLGAAESYMDGDWSTDDLPRLLQLFARDARLSGDLDRGLRRLKMPLERTWAWLRKNTPGGSRKNIAAHYDLSNEFYALWLDETMAYSSAIFADTDTPLAEASRHKFDLVCQQLDLRPGDELLEIGTGWGGLAVHAAENYGALVTTTTISRQQYDYTRQLITRRGLENRITLLDSDYRSLAGQYDKLASIEMIEAVGHEYLPTFFAKCDALLKPGGRMALQAITIPDQRYERYRHGVDFIQRYIFPGGALPSLGAIQRAVGDRTRLRMTAMHDYGQHYARTLAAWRERFFDHLHDVRRLGFDQRFVRTWDYYLAYCIAGFREQQIGLAQLCFEK